jgi:hypothetical protein
VSGTSYGKLRASHRWEVPERYNRRNAEEIKRFVRERLSAYAYPRAIEPCPTCRRR